MAAEVKRLHYFNGQFLREPDFTDEQKYHMDMRRMHNSLLHTWGIAKGLALSFASGASVVTVSEGEAIDGQGREIVLANDTDTQDLSAYKGKTVFVTIAFDQRETDSTNETGVTGNTRMTEKPLIEVSETAPVAGQKLILGQVTLDSNGKVIAKDDGVEPNKRRTAGVVGGDLEVRSLTLTDPLRVPAEWTKMSLGSANRADLLGSLKVTGNIWVTGTVDGRDVSADGTKLDTHAASTANPHSTTAAQVGALPSTGGTLSGDLQVTANIGITGTVDGRDVSADGTKLDSHVASTTNPHGTTAAQVGALVSVEGVSNAGGNIDLAPTNAIVITPDTVNKRITIGESHSALTTNPHTTTAAQVGALALTGGTLTGNLQVNGSIGIGTSPLDTLDVNGDVRVRGADIKDAGGIARISIIDNGNLELKEDNGTAVFTIDTDGKAGLGTNSNLSKLTVKGAKIIPSGTVATTANSNVVTGTGTSFLSHVVIGDWVWVAPPGHSAESRYVTGIASDTSLTVDTAFTLTTSGCSLYVFYSLLRAESEWSEEFFVSARGHVGIGTRDTGTDLLDVRGRCYSSGGWQTVNADYAEYFESADGKAIPIGTPVVLAGEGKIRAAKKGEAPIGIATENSAVVGNSYKEWPQKYVRDKFGRQITETVKEKLKMPKRKKVTKERQKTTREKVMEEILVPEIVLEKGKYVKKQKIKKLTREIEVPLFRDVDLFDETGINMIGKHQVPVIEKYEEEVDVLDENGQPVLIDSGSFVTVERPKLNPEYSEKKKYVPRGERPEWICVGLLGQLPLRKGNPVAPTWIKIKDLADDVELWLVK